ncbi:MAG: hypothetical protein BYD32DRAFT_434548 [Podila humilis]|nr:MAG: hypothetical protein BYD32DRAFT_440301 [Podila humilis]KAI9239761.1 MAG: hypothetical protein BYD32DRAFT_434548 [Podila humilis]
MPRSNEAIVNDALNMCSDMISNMGKFSNVPADCPKHVGFAEYSKLFCDSIVFWGLWNAMDESSKGRSMSKHISVLREIFANNSLETESIKPISSGFLYLGSVYFSNAQIQKCREECNTAFTPGYIAIKVSLHDCTVKKLMKKLEDMLSTFLVVQKICKIQAGLLHPFHHRMWAEDQSCVMWHKYYYFFLLCGI